MDLFRRKKLEIIQGGDYKLVIVVPLSWTVTWIVMLWTVVCFVTSVCWSLLSTSLSCPRSSSPCRPSSPLPLVISPADAVGKYIQLEKQIKWISYSLISGRYINLAKLNYGQPKPSSFFIFPVRFPLFNFQDSSG